MSLSLYDASVPTFIKASPPSKSSKNEKNMYTEIPTSFPFWVQIFTSLMKSVEEID